MQYFRCKCVTKCIDTSINERLNRIKVTECNGKDPNKKMFNDEKFEIALIQKKVSKQTVASILGISREALRRRIRSNSFTVPEVMKLREFFGKEVADGFLFNQ